MIRYTLKAFMAATALAAIGLSLIGYSNDPGPVRVIVKETPAGKITLGSGYATWDHWWGREQGRYRLEWNDAQWDAYLTLLRDSGADWVRLDFYYGNTEPRNDNNDPEVINWAAFTFNSPRLRSLYKHLDFFQANGIDTYLTYTYLRDNNEYNLDRLTGWLSKEAVSNGFPELWARPRDEPVDKRELAENLAATTYYLLKRRNYTNIKQVSLYVEPDNGRPTGGQWKNVDGYQDTIFLAKLLTKLGIRNQVAILAPHSSITDPEAWPPQGGDYDVHAIEDYRAAVDWSAPQEGLKNLYQGYETMVNQLKSGNPSKEVALVEYGESGCWGSTDASCAYRRALSLSSKVFELYNLGFGGMLRWAFEPFNHPYLGSSPIMVEGVPYAPAVPIRSGGQYLTMMTTISTAMRQGAKVVKVPYTYEPQRLVDTNLHRGSTVYQVEVNDPIPPGKGVYAIAAKDKDGKWHIGLINLHPSARNVEVVFPGNALPGQLRWNYYHAQVGLPQRVRDWLSDRLPNVEPLRLLFRATRFSIRKASWILGEVTTFPENSLQRTPPQLVKNTLTLHLPGQSLHFLSEVGGAE